MTSTKQIDALTPSRRAALETLRRMTDLRREPGNGLSSAPGMSAGSRHLPRNVAETFVRLGFAEKVSLSDWGWVERFVITDAGRAALVRDGAANAAD